MEFTSLLLLLFLSQWVTPPTHLPKTKPWEPSLMSPSSAHHRALVTVPCPCFYISFESAYFSSPSVPLPGLRSLSSLPWTTALALLSMSLPPVWVPHSQSMSYHGCLYLLWGECLPRSKWVILHLYLFFPFFSSISFPPFLPPFLSVLHAHTAIRTLCLVLSNSPSPKKKREKTIAG